MNMNGLLPVTIKSQIPLCYLVADLQRAGIWPIILLTSELARTSRSATSFEQVRASSTCLFQHYCVSSVLSQEIGWEQRIRDDILCRVERETLTLITQSPLKPRLHDTAGQSDRQSGLTTVLNEPVD